MQVAAPSMDPAIMQPVPVRAQPEALPSYEQAMYRDDAKPVARPVYTNPGRSRTRDSQPLLTAPVPWAYGPNPYAAPTGGVDSSLAYQPRPLLNGSPYNVMPRYQPMNPPMFPLMMDGGRYYHHHHHHHRRALRRMEAADELGFYQAGYGRRARW